MRVEQVTSMLYVVPYVMSRAVPELHQYHKALGLLLVTSQVYYSHGEWRVGDTLVTHGVIFYQTVLLLRCHRWSWLTAIATGAVFVAAVVHNVIQPRQIPPRLAAWWYEPLMHVALAAGAALYLLQTECR